MDLGEEAHGIRAATPSSLPGTAMDHDSETSKVSGDPSLGETSTPVAPPRVERDVYEQQYVVNRIVGHGHTPNGELEYQAR